MSISYIIRKIDNLIGYILGIILITVYLPILMTNVAIEISIGTMIGVILIFLYIIKLFFTSFIFPFTKLFLIKFLAFWGAIFLGIPFGMFTQFFDGIDDIPIDTNMFYELTYPLYRSTLGIYRGPIEVYPIFKVKLCSKLNI